uniref:Uncharacterized protein n=1 Tax=Globodera pallida TaxID=36090 RepID=A0A183CMS9_GLOPA
MCPIPKTTSAMDALVHSTHLYGRRLVLEWANQSEDVEEKRLRTTKRMALAPDVAGEEKRVRTAEEGADADGVASACRSSFQRERQSKA